MTDGERHGEYSQSEGQGYSHETNAEGRKCRVQHGGAASSENQPKRS
jgi:hypothetical protein